MNVGMLWFDNDTKSDLTTKIKRAAIYYQNKYGKHPNLCFVHPSMTVTNGILMDETPGFKAGEIEVRTTRSVLPNHIWIGINGANGSATT